MIKSSKRIQIYFELLIIPFVSERELTLQRKLIFFVSFLKYLRAEKAKIDNNDLGTYYLINGKAVNCDGVNCDTDNCIELNQIITKQYLWKGYIIVDQSNVKRLIERISSYRDCDFGFSWRFDENWTLKNEKLYNSDEIDLNPLKESSTVKSIDFGNIINVNRFVAHFKSEDQPMINNVAVDLNHFRKKVNVQFAVKMNEINEYKLEYGYDSIEEITISQVNDNSTADVYLHLSHPPKIFINTRKGQGNRFQWTRWLDCGIISQDVIGKTKVLRLGIDISKSISNSSSSSYISVLRTLTLHNGKKNKMSFAPMIEIPVKSVHHSVCSDLSFDVSYALDCITSQSYAFQDDLGHNHNDGFNVLVKKLIDENKSDQLVEALYRLADEYRTGQVYDAFVRFKQIFDKVDKEFKFVDNAHKSDHLKYIRDAVLTPTRIVFHPPSPCRTSYFLNIAESDYILRLSLRDEDQISTLRSPKQPETEPENAASFDYEKTFWKMVVSDRLLEEEGGLPVVNRLYKFYGSSPSQFKEGGMILYAKDSKGRTASSLRSSLGYVKEKTLSKYLSRIGLSLSTVMGYIDLPADTKYFISPDICGGLHPSTKQPYNFTDGCGFISSSLAIYLGNKLLDQKLISRDDFMASPPTAFQIRLMGSKGMLVVDKNLLGNSIVLRESMVKMIGKKSNLGVIKINQPRMAYLNRPFITIINQIGLKNEFFTDLLLNSLDELYKCFNDNSIAVSTLKMYSSIARFIKIESLVKAGYKLNDDPFFSSILAQVYNSTLEKIKSKARIALPMDKARTMFGVTDPTVNYPKYRLEFDVNGNVRPPKFDRVTNCLGTGDLKEGEVFVWPSDLPQPLDGELIVTKFPVSSPGDVRKLIAVNRPTLHHIRDCIVFPVDGTIPHPDEMGGSDLDGDEYCVIWLDDFKKIEIHPPMDFPSSGSLKECDEITDEKQIQYFIDYYKFVAIGLIANAHLAFADKDGIHSDKCKKLNLKNAGALDVAKQGIDDEYGFKDEDRCEEGPSFMGKDDHLPTYYSNRALEDIHTFTSLVQSIPQLIKSNFSPNEKLIHPNWKKFKKSAEEAHTEYALILNDLLRKLNCSSENELFTQTELRNWDYIYSAVMIVKETFVPMNKYFSIKDEPLCDKLARASAFYMVTHERAKTSGYCGLPFIGDCLKYLVKLLENNNTVKQSGSQSVQVSNPKAIGKDIKLAKKNMEIITIGTINKLTLWINSFGLRGKPLIFKKQLLLDCVNSFSLDKLGLSLKKIKKFAAYLIKDNHLDDSLLMNLSTGSDNLLVKIIIALLKHESVMFNNQPFELKQILVKDSNRVESLLETLKLMVTPAQIHRVSGQKIKYCIPVTIYGSPAAVLVASIVTRVYNRLTPIKRHVGQTNRHCRGTTKNHFKH